MSKTEPRLGGRWLPHLFIHWRILSSDKLCISPWPGLMSKTGWTDSAIEEPKSIGNDRLEREEELKFCVISISIQVGESTVGSQKR